MVKKEKFKNHQKGHVKKKNIAKLDKKKNDVVNFYCTTSIVPFDNTMKKDSELYQLFNTNFHEIAGVTR